MSIKIKYYFIIFLFFGCGNVNHDEIYESGIKELLTILPFDLTDNIFKNKACLISSLTLSKYVEFKRYLKETYLQNGYNEIGLANDKMLTKVLREYFEVVDNCNLAESETPIRDLCRQNGTLCIGLTPIYKLNGDDDYYYFTLTMPPNAGIELKVSRGMKTRIVRSFIK